MRFQKAAGAWSRLRQAGDPRFGLRQKIVLLLVCLTTVIVLILGVVAYTTIQRIVLNFQKSFDLEIPVARLLITIKEDMISRRDYLETYLLSTDVEELGLLVQKYGELSRRIGRYLEDPAAILLGITPVETPSARPFLQYLERRGGRPMDSAEYQDIREILVRARAANAEFERVGRVLLRNQLVVLCLHKDVRRTQRAIDLLFTGERWRPLLDADAGGQLSGQIELVRRLERVPETQDAVYQEEVEKSIRGVIGLIRLAGLREEGKARAVAALQWYQESLLILHHLSAALSEQRAEQERMFRSVQASGNLMTQLLTQADDIATARMLASQEDSRRLQDRSLALILVTWVAFLGVSVALGILLIRHITRPLVQLSQTARNVSDGIFGGEVKVEGGDEIALLADTFNRMSSKIEQQIGELKQADAMLIAQERLAAVGQITAGIAHEIRNPLSAIKMNVQILAKKWNRTEDDREYWEILGKEVDRLDRIVNLTLEYSHMPQLSRTWCDLGRILDECQGVLRQGMPEVRFEDSYDPGVPAVFLDEGRIKQVFLNILLNAYQSSEGDIAIRVATARAEQQGQPCLRVSISDRGAGIPPERLARIFDPFFSTKAKGTGLGLSISRRIVEEHGGRIEVTSRPPGEDGGAGAGDWVTSVSVLLPLDKDE